MKTSLLPLLVSLALLPATMSCYAGDARPNHYTQPPCDLTDTDARSCKATLQAESRQLDQREAELKRSRATPPATPDYRQWLISLPKTCGSIAKTYQIAAPWLVHFETACRYSLVHDRLSRLTAPGKPTQTDKPFTAAKYAQQDTMLVIEQQSLLYLLFDHDPHKDAWVAHNLLPAATYYLRQNRNGLPNRWDSHWAFSLTGLMFEQGRGGLSIDGQKAANWYLAAANETEAGSQDAFPTLSLARIYQHGLPGLPANPSLARQYQRQAAQMLKQSQ
ncbi:hypothetical protein [Leeia oryzae]|uniref:hypothetical protein n=1 Tax=Leeia oryzae TaxID=356662 RepID=UPI0004759F3D|nr:hypothetical protein [Leeia oryzae]